MEAAGPTQERVPGTSSARKKFSISDSLVVAWRLSQHVSFWRNINADLFICNTIETGYKLPFITTPNSAILENNKSALNQSSFVSSEIYNLLANGCIIECPNLPLVVNPLSVSQNSVGKLRLILDLRHVNSHLFKFPVKYEGINVLRDYLTANSYCIKFDLKSGYHHLGVFEPHRTFLGFKWELDSQTKFFKFLVLPFGLSSACSIFTKLMRQLVKKWRGQGFKIVIYLDDGICVCDNFDLLVHQAKIISDDLKQAGFVVNQEKSCWHPSRAMEWLGFCFDLAADLISVPERKILLFKQKCEKVIQNNRTSARELSSIVGLLISFDQALGSIVQFMSRSMQLAIIDQPNWDSKFTISCEVQTELNFWVHNIHKSNNRNFLTCKLSTCSVYCDASSFAGGGFISGRDLFAHRKWSLQESKTSSTFRELLAIQVTLTQLVDHLSHQVLRIFSDSRNACTILEKGSTKIHLQALAADIHNFAVRNNVIIIPQWVCREQNILADCISKMPDLDSWVVSDTIYSFLNSKWGPFTCDVFASSENNKCSKFYAREPCESCFGVDALKYSWHADNNWMVPPVTLIGKTILHAQFCKATGVLVVPKWVSASFWPMLIDGSGSFRNFVKEFIEYKTPEKFFSSVIGGLFDKKFPSNVLALKLEFS